MDIEEHGDPRSEFADDVPSDNSLWFGEGSWAVESVAAWVAAGSGSPDEVVVSVEVNADASAAAATIFPPHTSLKFKKILNGLLTIFLSTVR